MKLKILWVEDSARLELRKMMGPVIVSGEYDINLAEEVTSAVRYLLTKEYDAVILDMRLPPGMDDYWSQLYSERGEDKAQARLGLELATWLLNGHSSYSTSRPDWIKPHHVGVFTVENDPPLHDRLKELGIKVYQHKTAGLSDTILIDIIKLIMDIKEKARKGK